MFQWRQQGQEPEGYTSLLKQTTEDFGGDSMTPTRTLSPTGDHAETVRTWLLNCDDEGQLEKLEKVVRARRRLITGQSQIFDLDAAAMSSDAQDEDWDTPVECADGEMSSSNAPTSPQHVPSHIKAVLQFSSPKYYCREEDGTIVLDVLRTGDLNKIVEVTYETKDRTAIAGKNYVGKSGTLTFRPDVISKDIEIELLDDDQWGDLLEFCVELKAPDDPGIVIDQYLSTARVERIDDDSFPTNKFKREILERRVHEVNGMSLLWEYFKMSLNDPNIRRGTIKLIIIGQLHNMYYLFRLFMNVFLLDVVLLASHGDYSMPIAGSDRHLQLILVMLFNMVPTGMMHGLDYIKTGFGVAGQSRLKLQKGLANAFLNYSEASRTELNTTDLITAMTDDCETLIKVGFVNGLSILQEFGQVLAALVFQLSAPVLFQKKHVTLAPLIPMLMFPMLFACILALRFRPTLHVEKARLEGHRKLVAHVNDTVLGYRLIADCNRRSACGDTHEADVRWYNACDRACAQILMNNAYCMKWLSLGAVSIYTLVAGLDVIDGEMPVGIFLTSVNVFTRMGQMWGSIYTSTLEMFNSLPALERIVDYMNLPSDTRTRMAWTKRRSESTRERRATRYQEAINKEGLLLSPTSQPTNLEHIPIKVSNVAITLRTMGRDGDLKGQAVRETHLHFNLMEMQQGKLVSLVGKRGDGKSTLLRVLGGAILPDIDDGDVAAASEMFIPSHLRVLHVAAEPQFIRGTLRENLTFGTREGHEDGNFERVEKICRSVGLPESILKLLHQDVRLTWGEVLSHSQLHLLHIARALIANPDVLCIHKPTLSLNESHSERIIDLLKQFVVERGIELDPARRKERRPRTCIMTSSKISGVKAADSVFMVTQHRIQHILPVNVSQEHLD